MKIAHHPAPESLMSCSAGSMPEAFAAVMASHIAMCPECRSELAIMEQIGSVLFETLSPAAVAGAAPAIGAVDLDDEKNAKRRAQTIGEIPAPLVDRLGSSLDHVPWKRVGPGVKQHQITLSQDGRGTLRLIKVAPGRALPEHGHSGSELTLVLRGSFRDASGRYGIGDVADVSEEVEHAPIADAVDGCICLIATDGKLHFKSRIARLMQPLTGF